MLFFFRKILLYTKENLNVQQLHPPFNPSSSSVTAMSGISGSKLVIPDPPPQCDRDDFPDVSWWTRSEWTIYVEKQRAKGLSHSKLRFITREDGSALSTQRLKAISKAARLLWVSLYSERQDPTHWGTKTKFASDFFSNSMRLQFEEFRWCDSDWKVEVFATIRYPDWIGN